MAQAREGNDAKTFDVECLKEAFTLFDKDRDGEISTQELGKVIMMISRNKP